MNNNSIVYFSEIPRIHWLIGLPCIGKTTILKPLVDSIGLLYLTADEFVDKAWNTYLSDFNGNPELSNDFRAEYTSTIVNVNAFVQLHLKFGRSLIASIVKHVAELKIEYAVVEISSLYLSHIIGLGEISRFTIDWDTHENRLANALQIDITMAEAFSWTFILAEMSFASEIDKVQNIDLADIPKLNHFITILTK